MGFSQSKMGWAQSKNDSHMLHYYKKNENKLWIFEPFHERFYCFPCFMENGPFFFGGIESISVPREDCIYFIGGMG